MRLGQNDVWENTAIGFHALPESRCSGEAIGGTLLAVPCHARGHPGGPGPPGAESAGQRPGEVRGTSPPGSFISQLGHCLCRTLSLLELRIIVSLFSGFLNSPRGKKSRGRRCCRCRTGEQRSSHRCCLHGSPQVQSASTEPRHRNGDRAGMGQGWGLGCHRQQWAQHQHRLAQGSRGRSGLCSPRHVAGCGVILSG